MSKLVPLGPGMYQVPQVGGMRVPGLVIASEKLLPQILQDKAVEQVENVAHLPGIVGASIALPDIHWGYGFPIGGVAAMDDHHGVISPGGVGYDINCGVRLAMAPEAFKSLSSSVCERLIRSIFEKVPSGVGHRHRHQHKLSPQEYKDVLERGARWSLNQGFGMDEDLEHTESHGVIPGSRSASVSTRAKDRGQQQLGTIGSGNHFVEIGEVEHVFDTSVAHAWNIAQGLVYVMIHSGSRGLGHQVCQDTLDQFMRKGFAEGLPDRQLVAAPIQSPEGKQYLEAMAAAANFAFNNRQQVLFHIRRVFQEVLGLKPERLAMVYDVCHNIAKFEDAEVDGKKRRLCIHRKGATRAFGPGASELAPKFRATGQPVIVPGDMGRASYVMVGQGNPLTWCSACHGAGRAMSRVRALKEWKGKDTRGHMKDRGVSVMATSFRTISEEMPQAYKDVTDVVEATENAGLAKTVARLRPRLVIKG